MAEIISQEEINRLLGDTNKKENTEKADDEEAKLLEALEKSEKKINDAQENINKTEKALLEATEALKNLNTQEKINNITSNTKDILEKHRPKFTRYRKEEEEKLNTEEESISQKETVNQGTNEKLWDKKTAEEIKFEESPKDPNKKDAPLSDQGEGIPDTKEAKEFFEKLPEESKEKIKFGLSTVGFLVEQKKNNFYAKTFGYLSEKSAAKSKTVSNFLKNLGKGFEKDSKKAFNTAERITNEGEKHKRENATLLFGNILRHGRMITDLSGISFASPLRYVMMAGMALSRGSKAALETRLENEGVIEKTRIQDIEEAEKEAWKIYNKAKDENNGEIPSAEKLKDSYLKELPNDILKRFRNPKASNTIIQNAIKMQMEDSVLTISNKIYNIEKNSKISDTEKEQKINNIFKKYEEKLLDYDKIISQYGTVDVLSVAGRYAQTLGKGVVAVATIETLYLSAEKTIENISKILSSNETYIPETSATQPIAKIDSSNVKNPTDSLKLKTPANILEQQDSLKGNPGAKNLEKVLEDSTKTEKPILTNQEKIDIENNKILEHFKNQETTIHKGEGVEHSFIRQIEGNKELAEKLKLESNFKGDLNDPKVLHSFAQHQAHIIAMDEGYVNDSGQEVRITEANKVSYEIKTGANGEITVEEKGINGEDPNKYEKIYEKQETTHEDKNTFDNTYTEEKPYDEQEEIMKHIDSSNYEDTTNHTETTSGHKVIEYDDTLKENAPTQIDEANITKTILGKEYTALTWAKAPENIYHINLDQFKEMNELNTKNIDFIINNSPSNDIEKTELISILKEDKAAALIGMEDSDIDKPYRSLGAYINKLHEITKLEPKSRTIITPAETNENYIYRALMKAAELKKLGELKLSK
ncbi:MAG: hypothetical protein NDI62_00515 [Burkholderiales bacterium]|nr:hypothetical protein [Burkholderiales bacterium]